MPQLNPPPWFYILIFSCLVFILIIPHKVVAHTYPNPPTSKTTESPNTESSTWPW
uniref:ATP synthase complex subunit 8 n=1 Tax=Monopterus albus TaxID=43700 RepID=A0A0F6QH92_MONAL|nr:ATP synthase subunit 8 [Monopterus albus]